MMKSLKKKKFLIIEANKYLQKCNILRFSESKKKKTSNYTECIDFFKEKKKRKKQKQEEKKSIPYR